MSETPSPSPSSPTAAATRRHTVFVAFDIESTGMDTQRCPIVMIGAAAVVYDHQTQTTGPWQQRRWPLWQAIEMPAEEGNYGSFSKAAWEGFWSKRGRRVLQSLRAETALWMPSHAAIDLRYWLDDLHRRYDQVVMGCDNPQFDIGRLDQFLCQWCPQACGSHVQREWTLSYGPPDARGRQAYCGRVVCVTTLWKAFERWADRAVVDAVRARRCPFKHDHFPENDAATVAWRMLQLDLETHYFSGS
jgi:hypothetical protein